MATKINLPSSERGFCAFEDLETGDVVLWGEELYLITDTGELVGIKDGFFYDGHIGTEQKMFRLVNIEINVTYL